MPISRRCGKWCFHHLHEKEVLDGSLPVASSFGPFYINVDNVKQSLSKKRKALATAMLDILAKNLQGGGQRKCPPVRPQWLQQHMHRCMQSEAQGC